MVKRRKCRAGAGRAACRARGVALVDAIVASVILGVALAVIISLSGRAVAAQAEGHRLATAARLADEQLSLVLARGVDDYSKRFPAQGKCDEPFQEYSYQLTFVNGAGNEPVTVKAVISWESSSGPARSVEVTTRIAPRPGDNPDRVPQTAPERTAP